MIIINNAKIIAETRVIERGWLQLDAGKILAFDTGEPPSSRVFTHIDATGLILLPGFVDLHVHGGGGYEAMDATPEALRAMSRFFARHGVTSYLPTTWTASHDAIMKALRVIQSTISNQSDGATIIGAHVEGPYISPNRPGAQDPNVIRVANKTEARELLETDIIQLLALAPEIEANQWLIEACIQRGITVSAAHTDATYEDIVRATEQGITQITHTFNAMRGLHHREPGVVGAAFMLPELRCEIIADGVHVHPQMVRLVYQMKGAGGMIAITDAVRGAGLPEGTTYEQDGRTVTVQNGSARLEDGILAGSVLTMDAALRNLMQFTGAPLEEIWPCVSLTPAQAIHIDERKGSIAVGKDADLVLLNANLDVVYTFVEGELFDG